MGTIIRLICLLLLCVLPACGTVVSDRVPDESVSGSQKASAPALPLVFSKLDDWLAENKLVINAGRSENMDFDGAFAQGAVISYGEGSPKAGTQGGQKYQTAMRAAEVVAQRNMAEFFARYAAGDEIRFTSYTTHLKAFLKGAVVVTSEYNPWQERAAVLLKLDLQGAKGFIK